ncbi:uncharacterized protein KY384_008373 [Bacidia gigantensis]|uniref:uncharacterized protein n=1 Tax=Bacidia gigantensis TaxID=2732470 RepID=UPI001D057F9A|nr:uncharacterized protein KY384_008373 [Bacidia gigantensis]KAG8526944.1 hypothetical protein KY384_008373 [Bacidia gigantensis]
MTRILNADGVTIADELEDTTIATHPLGVKPLGNLYIAEKNLKAAAGHFAVISDDLLLKILEWLDVSSLTCVSATCKALYGFVDCSGLFSDTLHRPFRCSHILLSQYTNIPAKNVISRFPNLNHSEFEESWTCEPFVLTDPVKSWPIFADWSIEKLGNQYNEVKFRAEAVDWPLGTYIQYMRNNTDESPLYLFDRSFADKMALTTGSYTPPSCFGADLFHILGEQRPDHKWLIIGPERSGSTFHKDPNATSAWNSVIRGSKFWILFPPTTLPPGVFVSEDQSEVTSPLSIAEWFLEFHAQARDIPGCKEGICSAGEVLHVPSGWWHLVVNLEESIAVTQNFVPESHLSNVLDFMKNKSDQVSGFIEAIQSPYNLFVERMRQTYPKLLVKGLEQARGNHVPAKRMWQELGDGHDLENKRQDNFNFGFDDDVDIT